LKALIYAMTVAKMLVHGLARFVTRGHRGRVVTSWQELHLALASADSTFKERIAP